MAEIIRPNFGARTPPEEPKNIVNLDGVEVDERERAMLALFVEDVGYALIEENRTRIREACARGDEATDYIFSMSGFHKKNESLNLRQEALETTPLEKLCALLLESNKLEWQKQPHLIGAIIVEMDRRFEAIKMFRPDINLPEFKE